MKYLCITVLTLSLASALRAQQVPDTLYSYPVAHPAYAVGLGPQVFIDGAHHNFHTRKGGFLPFSKLLEQDGYRVANLDKALENPAALKNCKVLVIANALNKANLKGWTLPTPSAFTDREILTLRQWVQEGGSLFLIADHMPFAGAATALGAAFGFGFINGFAMKEEQTWPPMVFTLADGTLKESPVQAGSHENEKTDSIATFTGSAFTIPSGAIAVLSFPDSCYSLQPDTAWQFHPNTPRIRLGGYHQGALLPYGKGRVAVFGEAAMFTAQIANGTLKAGFNAPEAPHNAQFVLNLIHWLDGSVKPEQPSKIP